MRRLVAAALAAAALAGCGGGGGKSSPSPTRSSAASTPASREQVVERIGTEGGFDAQRIYKDESPGVVTIISIFGGGSSLDQLLNGGGATGGQAAARCHSARATTCRWALRWRRSARRSGRRSRCPWASCLRSTARSRR
jgi:hypothetical protein